MDAAQGVEAQTLANVNLAYQSNLELIPVINKIDLPAAEPERVREEIENVLALDASDAILASAKTGIGIDEILEAIVERIPPPARRPARARCAPWSSTANSTSTSASSAMCASWTAGSRPGTQMRFMATGKEFEVTEVGTFAPQRSMGEMIETGEVGYIAASIKTIGDANVGDTITDAARLATEPLPGYRNAKPMVFCGLYPMDGAEYSGTERGALQAATERRRALLRGGDLRRPRLRLPLRLPRPAPHGVDPGAAGARVRPVADRHLALRRLPDPSHQR